MNVAAKSSGQAERRRAGPAGLRQVRRGRSARRRRSRPRASRRSTDAQLKTQCKQEYDALRDQVLQLLISFQWIQGEAEGRRASRSPTPRSRSPSTSRRSRASRRTPTSRSSSRTPARREDDILQRVKLDLLSNKIRDKVVKGKDKVSDAADRGLLQQEQGPLRAARAARPAHRPDQGQGQGRRRPRRRSRAASRGSPSPRSTRSTRRPRPQGGKLPAAGQGQAGEGSSTTRVFARQEGQARRPGQDPVRLLRLRRSTKITTASPAVARRRPRTTIKQTLAVAEPAEGARHVRQGLPQALEGQDGLPRGLQDAGLQERPEGDADADGRARRRRSSRSRSRDGDAASS